MSAHYLAMRFNLSVAAAIVCLTAFSACAAEPVAVSAEPRAVLERFVGNWSTEASIRRLLPTEHETNTRGRGKCISTLGGRYYEFRTATPGTGNEPGDSELQVMTYDEDQNVFHQWVFSSDGYHHEATGTWNPATSTLRWQGRSGENTFVIDDRFIGADTLRWTLTRTNAEGQTVQTITGVLRRELKGSEGLTTEDTGEHRAELRGGENHR